MKARFLQAAIKRACHPERSEGSEPNALIFWGARVEQRSRSFGRVLSEFKTKALPQDDMLFFMDSERKQVILSEAKNLNHMSSLAFTAQGCRSFSRLQMKYLGKALPQDDMLPFYCSLFAMHCTTRESGYRTMNFEA
jgi:hypothetical protein